MKKKIISLLLAIAMSIAALPVSVYAVTLDEDEILSGEYNGKYEIEFVSSEDEDVQEDDASVSLMSLLELEEIDAALVLTDYSEEEIQNMPLSTVLSLLQDTDGNYISIADDAKVVWAHFKDDEGNVIRDEYHEIDRDETVDLSEFSYTSGYTLELIVGSGNQLDPNNKRYIIRVYTSNTVTEVLEYELYTQDEENNRQEVVPDKINTSVNTQSGLTVTTNIFVVPEHQDETEYYVGINSLAELHPYISVDVYTYTQFMYYLYYGSEYAEPITDSILNQSMKNVDAGYKCCLDVTTSTYDTKNMFFLVYIDSTSNSIISYEIIALVVQTDVSDVSAEILAYSNEEMTDVTLFEVTEAIINYADIDFGNGTVDNLDAIRGKYFMLENGYSADDEYYCALNAHSTIWDDANSHVEKAVVGLYDTLEDAAGQEDIKDQLIPSDRDTLPLGYKANYNYKNEGVYFTVFFDDGNVWKFNVRITEYDSQYDPSYMPDFDPAPIVGAQDPYFRVDGVIQNDEALDCYVVENGKAINMDTLYGYGYQTIFINDTDVDLSKLQPTFWFGNDERVHTTYVGIKQESGVSVQDFSEGAVQYGTIIDNNTKNYNVTFVKKENGPKLYVNGPSQREILLDEYFENKHDILIANVGDEPLTGISVELNATNVKLDDYWTVGGTDNDTLAAFTTTESDSDYGELNNIGKIRLLPDGEGDIEGTLTISADGQEDVVINLTGRASNPQIVTDSLEDYHAVKYVPYAYLVSTNNMNDWNNVSFKLISGSLPNGVTLNESTGEVYGVPTETGEFTFTVQADYSYEGFESSQQELTLTVDENTDENVAAQIDEGYEIKVAIPETVTGETNIVWEIEYDYNDETASEFQGVWLDGEKLVVDTDYTVEPGSTKITVKSQTVGSTSDGSHTISAEYRTSDNNELKKSAQNYTKSSSGSNSSSSSSSSSSRSSGSSTPSSYKVWFEVNGGAWLDALTVTRNTTADLPTPERYGYAFGGWYTDEGLTQLFDVNTKINKTTTLYAKWIPLYTIWFEECGGEDVADITVQEGNTAGTLPTPVREGYVFLGWYKDENLTQEYDGTEAVSESIAIFAKWIEDTPPVDASGFIDVDANDWFFSDVEWVYDEQFMVGTSNITFEPNEAVTGGMVVTVLARLANADVSEYEDMTFEDVYEDQWYTPYAKWAKAIGLVDGIPFNPPEEISREAMGVILARFIDYMDAEYEIDDEEIVFADSELISPEAADSMQTLFKLEIFKGKGNNIIDPLSNTTRAEYAALIHRINAFLEDTTE